MRVSLLTLKQTLENNVAEIKFQRRKPKPGAPLFRRMLCTNSQSLLNSSKGRTALNYMSPKTGVKYNPDAKNIVITWDIFMQDFRCVSLESCDLISLIPAGDEFWLYFTEKVARMSAGEKQTFMSI